MSCHSLYSVTMCLYGIVIMVCNMTESTRS